MALTPSPAAETVPGYVHDAATGQYYAIGVGLHTHADSFGRSLPFRPFPLVVDSTARSAATSTVLQPHRVLGRELMAANAFRDKQTASQRTPFSHHVAAILLPSPKKQMLDVSARRIVAAVTHAQPVRHGAVRQRPGNDMRQSGANSRNRRALAVVHSGPASLPFEASVFGSLVPEPEPFHMAHRARLHNTNRCVHVGAFSAAMVMRRAESAQRKRTVAVWKSADKIGHGVGSSTVGSTALIALPCDGGTFYSTGMAVS
jgi:hypothetical protein